MTSTGYDYGFEYNERAVTLARSEGRTSNHALKLTVRPVTALASVRQPSDSFSDILESGAAIERASLLETDRVLAEAYSTSDTPLDAVFASFADDVRVLAPDVPVALGWEASRAVFAKRQPDSSWKIAVDMFNSDGPPVPATE